MRSQEGCTIRRPVMVDAHGAHPRALWPEAIKQHWSLYLIEGIVLHSFEGKAPFSPETLTQIASLKQVYGHELTAADSHQLYESDDGQ